jgi:signal peptidase II
LNRRILLPPWLWTPLVLVIDFVSKRLVLAHVDALLRKVEVIGSWVRFTYVRNPGTAMGLFSAGRTTLIAISLVASLCIAYLYGRTDREQFVRRGALAAILGGALGNLVDRFFYGGRVVDFIDIGVGVHRFYTFNVADMGVSLGGAVLFLSLLSEGSHSRNPEP